MTTMNISQESNASSTHGSCNLIALMPLDVAVHILNFLFGIPTQSYVFWLIFTGTGRGFAFELFQVNISVCEVMFCVRSGMCVLIIKFPHLWDIVPFLAGFVITGRPLFQCLICVERYLAVVHPVTFLKFKPLRYRIACSTILWIVIFISCAFCWQVRKRCSVYLFTCFYISQFLLSLFINMFCCLAVLRALKQSGPGERGREREEKNHMKRRAFYLILINTVTFIITYVPSSLVALQHLLPMSVIPELDTISLTTFSVAGFVQPLLYVHRVRKLPFCNSP